MNNNSLQLNHVTKSLKRLFPALTALMVFTPQITAAETTISVSTDKAQTFASDSKYIILEGINITPKTTEPAVTVSGNTIKNIINNGTITGISDGMYINAGGQNLVIDNQEKGVIESTGANGITVVKMAGTIKNAGKIGGAENGIRIEDKAYGFVITNDETGSISGKTALSSDGRLSLSNAGNFTGTSGNGLELSKSGASLIDNSGTIKGAQNGIIVNDDNLSEIVNSGLITGTDSAITFKSTQNNSLTLTTGSHLEGDVISTNSTGNTLMLEGNGSEDSNFRGLNKEDGFASLTMNGEAWALTGNVDIIGSGDSLLVNTGTLTLAGDVKNDAGNTRVVKAATLQLGDGTRTGSLTGTLKNDGKLIFNQGTDSTFAVAITGEGSVEKADSNRLLLTGKNSYTGDTLLKSGTTLVAEGAELGGKGNTATITLESGATLASAGTVNNNVDILSGGVLASWNAISGNSTTSSETANTINGNVSNSGTLQIGGQNNYVGNQFVINGDYTGTSGSLIAMNSVLGDDSSTTDHLAITGSSAGQSGVNISNIGGMGARTVNGMQVISVGGNSDAAFSLSTPVVVGAWEYSLNKHSDGNWYLESKTDDTNDNTNNDNTNGNNDNGSNTDNSGTNNNGGNNNGGNGNNTPVNPGVMAPEVGAYLGNYMAAQGMFLHKRDDRDQLTQRNGEDLNTWMYVKGDFDNNNDVAGGKVTYDTTRFVMQVGSDVITRQLDNGVLHGGVMFGAGQAKTDSTSTGSVRSAHGKVDGVNVGVYTTWQEDKSLRKGSYIDSWASFSWYHNKLRSDGRSNETYGSKGFAASLEAGHAWVMDSEKERTWKFEPQVQAIYSYLDQENHTDASGVRVSTPDNDGILTRVGVKTSYFNQKDVQLWQPYVAVNWLNGAGQNDIAFNGEKVSNSTPENRGQLELGVTGKLNPTTIISLRASGEWGENSYDAYGGHILLNHRW